MEGDFSPSLPHLHQNEVHALVGIVAVPFGQFGGYAKIKSSCIIFFEMFGWNGTVRALRRSDPSAKTDGGKMFPMGTGMIDLFCFFVFIKNAVEPIYLSTGDREVTENRE